MKPIRRIAFLLWLALAVAMGQQAVALHDLGHALNDPAGSKHPAPQQCDTHFACSQLGSAVGSVPLVLALPVARPPLHQAARRVASGVAARLGFLARAPPVLSA